MTRRRALGTALAALTCTLGLARGAAAYPVETLRTSGPPEQRIDLVILGDGYRAQDQDKLSADAQTAAGLVFGLTPFAEYAGLFNVKLIHVTSNQNGADQGSYGATRDTALGANFGCYGIDRLLCVDDAKVLSVAAADVPEADLVVVLVNDPKYGGSGGPVVVISTQEQALPQLPHEMGHSLGDLADEYTAAYPGFPACSPTLDCAEPNVTLRSTRDSLKWKAWVASSTPIPTPAGAGYDGVGCFDGARYLETGVYRPVDEACLMRNLSVDFCPVCAEGLVRALWGRVSPIDSLTPPATEPVRGCGAITLSVATPTLTPSSLRFAWSVDGALQAETRPSFTLEPTAAGGPDRVVTVRISDTTPLVRSDPQAALVETAQWTVQAGCDDGDACTLGDSCAAGACVPASRVTCVAKDECHEVGSCAPATGVCDDPAKADGVACSLGSCRGGLCTTEPPTVPAGSCGCELPGQAPPAPSGARLAGLLALASVALRGLRRRPAHATLDRGGEAG